MQIEEAIEKIQELLNLTNWYPKYGYKEAIVTTLNYIDIMQSEFDRLEGIEDNTAMLKMELEKKEIIIELMANKLVEAHSWFYSEFDNFTEKDWIDYFTKKVEGK